MNLFITCINHEWVKNGQPLTSPRFLFDGFWLRHRNPLHWKSLFGTFHQNPWVPVWKFSLLDAEILADDRGNRADKWCSNEERGKSRLPRSGRSIFVRSGTVRREDIDRISILSYSIPRFEQRLRCLHLIRTFRDRVDALIPHIQAVTKASSAVSSNKRLRQYLALVLAIGNYLNHGKRNGNAYGFDVQSLNRLMDVKQSQKSDRNLLHYVIQLIEKKWPDLTKLKRDLASVFDAARFKSVITSSILKERIDFSRAEVLTEMRSLEQAIQIVRNELEKKEIPQEASLTDEGRKEREKDRLSTVAKHFVSTATVDYGNLEKLMAEMNTKVRNFMQNE